MIEQIVEDIALFKTRRETCREPRIQKLWKEEIARLASARGRAQAPGGRHPPIAISPSGST